MTGPEGLAGLGEGLVRRLVVGVAVAPLVGWLLAGPALAHATFPGGTTYPSGTDQRLVMDVAHEREPGVYNTAVSAFLPSSWSALACEAAPTWQCQVTTADGRPVIRWTKDAGAPQTPNDETFAFTARIGPPGAASLPVTQTYSTGEVVRWIGPSNSEEPAPVLESAPGGVSATTTPPTTVPHTTVPSPTPTTPGTTRVPSPTTAAPRTTGAPAVASTTAAPAVALTTTTTVAPGTIDQTSLPEETTTTPTTPESSAVSLASGTPKGDSSTGSSWPWVLVVLIAVGAAAFAAPTLWRRRKPARPTGE